jgi:hypothetical protein
MRGRGQKGKTIPKQMAKYFKPSYPEINGYKFLTGDLNWEDNGARWYNHEKGDDYASVLEIINMRESVDEDYPDKYMVTVHSVSWDDPKKLKSALATIGEEHNKHPSLVMKIDALSAYGGDLINDYYGDNAKELVENAMRWN